MIGDHVPRFKWRIYSFGRPWCVSARAMLLMRAVRSGSRRASRSDAHGTQI